MSGNPELTKVVVSISTAQAAITEWGKTHNISENVWYSIWEELRGMIDLVIKENKKKSGEL